MKAQVSFSLIFLCLHTSFSSSPAVNDRIRRCTPLEATRDEWWPDACFLWKQCFSCLSLVFPIHIFQRTALFPVHVLCVVSEAPKNAGCCGNEMQEHKKAFLRPTHNTRAHTHICQHENELPADTEQN